MDEADKPGTWRLGCGRCPSETRVRNLRIFEWHDPEDDESVAACPQQGHGKLGGLPNNFLSRATGEHPKVRAQVAEELEWCGCGDNDRVDELMLAYLDWLELDKQFSDSILAEYGGDLLTSWKDERWTQDRAECPLDEDVRLLVMYVADHLGWTEHGSSVYGAWLTDDGREALANLRRPEYDMERLVPYPQRRDG